MIQLSERMVKIQLSERRVDPVIKRGGLIQLPERRVEIQLSREDG